MGSRRYLSERDPGAAARYSLRADARLRAAFIAQRLAKSAGGYVPLVNDDIGPGLEWLYGIRQIFELGDELMREAAVYVLASGGTLEQIAQMLRIGNGEAVERFGELWAARQAEHAAAQDETPIDDDDPGQMYDLGELDRWCAMRDPGNGADQVTGGLVHPRAGKAEVRTRAEVEDADHRILQEAKGEIEYAEILAKHDAAVAAALKRLARRRGTARSSLWNDRRPPYVLARDGALLGVVEQIHLAAGSDRHEWEISRAPGGVTAQERTMRFTTLAAVTEHLERRAAAPEEGRAG